MSPGSSCQRSLGQMKTLDLSRGPRKNESTPRTPRYGSKALAQSCRKFVPPVRNVKIWRLGSYRRATLGSETVGAWPLCSLANIRIARASCRWFDEHATAAAAARAFCSAGSSTEINTAMMPMTTSSSTSVKAAARQSRLRDMRHLALSGLETPSLSYVLGGEGGGEGRIAWVT